jgi:hypothetical protein
MARPNRAAFTEGHQINYGVTQAKSGPWMPNDLPALPDCRKGGTGLTTSAVTHKELAYSTRVLTSQQRAPNPVHLIRGFNLARNSS